MVVNGKRILIIGAAMSGIASAEVLSKMGAYVTLNDKKTYEQLKDSLQHLKNLNIDYKLGLPPEDLVDDADMVVVSPGVPLDQPFYDKAMRFGIEVIGEVELSYRLCKLPFIAITGTNGKTTTTSLTYEIFKNASIKVCLAGNIGIPMIKQVTEADPDTIVIAEISSFQLESIKEFKPVISAILNVTPDHLNRHKTMENYINAKARIFENQTEKDHLVLNYDNLITRDLAKRSEADVIFFSREQKLERGFYVDNGYIVENSGNNIEKIIPVKDIYIPGKHNLENALAACAISRQWGISPAIIADTLRTFKGVEHRIEYVTTINGVRYYNDSKGTNTDASIKAIEALDYPLILIVGGYDKGEDFTQFIKAFNGKVKALLLMGTTADKIDACARKHGFNEIYRVSNMEEAVKKAAKLANKGDAVLLSPACASWDMYDNFEQRGRIFKNAVMSIGG